MSFSVTTYPNGGQGNYAVPFPYIAQAHVFVLDNGAAYTGSVTWTGPNSVFLSPDISADHTVTIQRVTPRTPLAVFNPGTISSDDLNLDILQLCYLAQEALDGGGGGGGGGSGGDLTAFAIVAALGYTPENSAHRGAANGYAPLGSDSKVPSANLPAAGGSTATTVTESTAFSGLRQAADDAAAAALSPAVPVGSPYLNVNIVQIRQA